jgi:hypothetical protein
MFVPPHSQNIGPRPNRPMDNEERVDQRTRCSQIRPEQGLYCVAAQANYDTQDAEKQTAIKAIDLIDLKQKWLR